MTGENSHQVDRGRHHLGKLWDSWVRQRTEGRKESPQALWQKIVPASEACSLKREIILRTSNYYVLQQMMLLREQARTED